MNFPVYICVKHEPDLLWGITFTLRTLSNGHHYWSWWLAD